MLLRLSTASAAPLALLLAAAALAVASADAQLGAPRGHLRPGDLRIAAVAKGQSSSVCEFHLRGAPPSRRPMRECAMRADVWGARGGFGLQSLGVRLHGCGCVNAGRQQLPATLCLCGGRMACPPELGSAQLPGMAAPPC